MKNYLIASVLLVALGGIWACNSVENDELAARVDTLEKVTLQSVQSQITAINTTLGTLQATQAQVSGYVSGLQTSVQTLQGDYVQLDGMVKDLSGKNEQYGKDISELKSKMGDAADLKKWVEESYVTLKAFETLQTDVSGIKTDISTIFSRLDGLDETTKELAKTLQESTEDITSRLGKCEQDIEGIKKDLQSLQDDMDSVKAQIAAIVSAVQSVVVIPDYSDGSVKMTAGDHNPLRFEVYPLEAAKNLANLGVSALSLDCVQTQTKADGFINIPLTEVSYADGVMTVVADGSELPESIKSGDSETNARLRISDGTVTRSSEFFMLTYSVEGPVEVRYTTTDGSMIDIADYTFIAKHYKDSQTGENVLVLDVHQISETLFKNNDKLLTVNLSEGVRHISQYAFSGCTSLKSISLPSSVKSIGEYAFSRCRSLVSIDIPEGVTSIPLRSFEFCTSLKSITIPSSVNSIGVGAFTGCSSLESIELPVLLSTISGDAFAGCSSLKGIIIPPSVESIEYCAFQSCSSLLTISIPSGVKSIGNAAFSLCEALTSVTILGSKLSVGVNPFYGCPKLASFDSPLASDDNRCLIIDGKLVSFCPYSESGDYIIPEGVISIGQSAFSRCSGLTSITIPDSVNEIGTESFRLCSSLQSIVINSVNPPTVGGYAFEYTNDCPIYVPAQSYTSYMAAPDWSRYYLRLRYEPEYEPVEGGYCQGVDNRLWGYFNGINGRWDDVVTTDSSDWNRNAVISGGYVYVPISGNAADQYGVAVFNLEDGYYVRTIKAGFSQEGSFRTSGIAKLGNDIYVCNMAIGDEGQNLVIYRLEGRDGYGIPTKAEIVMEGYSVPAGERFGDKMTSYGSENDGLLFFVSFTKPGSKRTNMEFKIVNGSIQPQPIFSPCLYTNGGNTTASIHMFQAQTTGPNSTRQALYGSNFEFLSLVSWWWGSEVPEGWYQTKIEDGLTPNVFEPGDTGDGVYGNFTGMGNYDSNANDPIVFRIGEENYIAYVTVNQDSDRRNYGWLTIINVSVEGIKANYPFQTAMYNIRNDAERFKRYPLGALDDFNASGQENAERTGFCDVYQTENGDTFILAGIPATGMSLFRVE